MSWEPKRFIFHSDQSFEDWDYTAPDLHGIGGSETHQIEMSWRLARRGHSVLCYSPLRQGCVASWRKTEWRNVKDADYSEPGIWLIYRNPVLLDKFEKRPGQTIWFIAQDTWYPAMSEERAAKIDSYFTLCPEHAKLTLRHALYLKDKLVVSSNGIRADLIRAVEAENIERNPHRLMYASSPDRGLPELLKIFKRARYFVPDLELHAFYGFDNIDKLITEGRFKDPWRKLKSDLERLMDQPGVTWHGRIPQTELTREWFKTGLWCYPTNFFETSCITCMEAQATGAIPITNPIGALAQNVRHGVFIDGDVGGDAMVQARYVAEIVRMATTTGLQDSLRPGMMLETRTNFNWDILVDVIECNLFGWQDRLPFNQYNFQIRHAHGRIVNIGCHNDGPKFGAYGAVNVDTKQRQSHDGERMVPDVIADARSLPLSLYGAFDSVVLGDILEHMDDADAVLALKNAARALENGGDIIITCPNDNRSRNAQANGSEPEQYVDGVRNYHIPVPRDRLDGWIKDAGLRVTHYREIDYGFTLGHGVVATKQ